MTDASQISGEIKLDKEFNLGDDFSPPSYQEWKDVAEQALKGANFDKKLVTKTYEGIDLQPIYTSEDLKGLSHLKQKPGFSGNIRGTYASGYLKQPWEISQTVSASSAEEYNKALKNDLQRGQSGLTILLHKNRLDELSIALEGIDLEKYPIHIIPNHSALESLQFLNSLLTKHGKDANNVHGSVDADPLGYLALHGSLTESVKNVQERMAESITYAQQNLPNIKTIGVCSLPYHNAGADAVSELAYVLASAVKYIDWLAEYQIHIDTIATNMRFTFAIGPFYFMEIAKLRAARLLWAKIIEAYGGSQKAAKMTIHGKTSTYNQTVYDPYVNMLRTTTETFAAIVGSVDSLNTNPFDESFGQGNEFSRRVARNTQIVLEEECGMDRLIDPAGGSYFLEKLTHQVAEKAWHMFKEIESLGGMLDALKKGRPQKQISEVAEKRRRDIAKRKSIIVGTNFSANVKEKSPETATQNAKNTDTLIPAKNLKKAIEITPLNVHRQSEIFEVLRNAVETYKAKHNSETGPKLFLATMGALAQYKARADFSQGFFEVGGFDVTYPQGAGFESPAKAAEAAGHSGADVVVICSTDDTYPELVPPLVKGLKEKNPEVITVLAGYPKDQIENHKKAGIDEFIYLGVDAHQVLSRILKQLGVL